jgi:hypothetical protein
VQNGLHDGQKVKRAGGNADEYKGMHGHLQSGLQTIWSLRRMPGEDLRRQ